MSKLTNIINKNFKHRRLDKILSVVIIILLLFSASSSLIMGSSNQNTIYFNSSDENEEKTSNENVASTSSTDEEEEVEPLGEFLIENFYYLLKNFLDKRPRLANMTFFKNLLEWLNESRGGDDSPEEDTESPSQVINLIVTDAFDGKLSLSWDDASDNVGVDHYKIYRDDLHIVDVANTEYLDTGLVNDQSYSYKVCAVDAADNVGENSSIVSGTPTESFVDTIVPSQVTGLNVVDAKDGKLDLSWDAATDNVGVDHYKVYRDGLLIDGYVVNTIYQDSGLTNDISYSYQVCAVDAAGNIGANSSIISGIPTQSMVDNEPPSQVTGLTVVDAFNGKLSLSWAAATDNVGVDHYRIYRDGSFLVDVSATSYLDTGLVNDISYDYQVSALDAEGNEGQKSSTVSGTPTEEAIEDNEPPSQVTGLTVVDANNGALDISWNAATDNVEVDYYKIYRDSVLVEDNVEITEYFDTGLENDQSYSYQVSAVDTSGNEGQKSASISGTPTESMGDATILPESGHIMIGGNGYLDINATLDINGTLVILQGTVYLSTGLESLHIWWNLSTGFFMINASGFSEGSSFSLVDFHIEIKDPLNDPVNILLFDFDHVSMDGPGSLTINAQGQQGNIVFNGNLKVGEVNAEINLNDIQNVTIQGSLYSGNYKEITGEASIQWDLTGDHPIVYVYGDMTRDAERQINIDNLLFEIQGVVSISADKINFSSESHIEIGDGYIDISESIRSITLQDLAVNLQGFNIQLSGRLELISGRNTTFYFNDEYINVSFSNGMTSFDLSDFYLDVNGIFSFSLTHLHLMAENQIWISIGEELQISAGINSLIITECTISPTSDIFFKINGSFDLSNAENGLVINFIDLQNFELTVDIDGSITFSDVVLIYDDLVTGTYVKLSWASIEIYGIGSATLKVMDGKANFDIDGTGGIVITDFLLYFDTLIPAWDGYSYIDISLGITSLSMSLTADVQDVEFNLLAGTEQNDSDDSNESGGGSGGGSGGSSGSGIDLYLSGDIQLSGDVQIVVNVSFQSFKIDVKGSGDAIVGDLYVYVKDKTDMIPILNSITVDIEYIQLIAGADIQVSGGIPLYVSGALIINNAYVYFDTTFLTGEFECDYAYVSFGVYVELPSLDVISAGGYLEISGLYISSGGISLSADLIVLSGSVSIKSGSTTTISAGLSYGELENFVVSLDGLYVEISGILNLQGNPLVATIDSSGVFATLSGNPSLEDFHLGINDVAVDITSLSASGGGTIEFVDADKKVIIDASIDSLILNELSFSSAGYEILTLSGSFELSADISFEFSGEGEIEIDGSGTISDLYFESQAIGIISCSFIDLNAGLDVSVSLSSFNPIQVEQLNINGAGTMSADLYIEIPGKFKLTCTFIELNANLEIGFSSRTIDFKNIDFTASDLTIEANGEEKISDFSGIIQGSLRVEWSGTIQNLNGVNLTGDVLINLDGFLNTRIGVISFDGMLSLNGDVYLNRIEPGCWLINTNGITLGGTLEVGLGELKIISMGSEITIDGRAIFTKESDGSIEFSLTMFTVSGGFELEILGSKIIESYGTLTGDGDLTVGINTIANGYLHTNSHFSITGDGIKIGEIDILTSLVLSQGSYFGWNVQAGVVTLTFDDFNANLHVDINNLKVEIGNTHIDDTVISICKNQGYVMVDGRINFNFFTVTYNGELLFEAFTGTVSNAKFGLTIESNRVDFLVEQVYPGKDPVLSFTDGSLYLFGRTIDTFTIVSGQLKGSFSGYFDGNNAEKKLYCEGSEDSYFNIEINIGNIFNFIYQIGYSSDGGSETVLFDFTSENRYLDVSRTGIDYVSKEVHLKGFGVMFQDAGDLDFRFDWEPVLTNVSFTGTIPEYVHIMSPFTDGWMQLWPLLGGELHAFIEAPNWAKANENIRFDGVAIGGDGVYTYEWDFNNDEDHNEEDFENQGQGTPIWHAYPKEEGECQHHQVVLRVTDSSGREVYAAHDIDITSLEAYHNGPYSFEVGEEVILDGTASAGCYENVGGAYTKFAWTLYYDSLNPNGNANFGQEFSEGAIQRLVDVKPGNYNAKFTVSTFMGNTLVEQDEPDEMTNVFVGGAAISADKSSVDINEEITFTIQTFGGPFNSVVVDFGDGETTDETGVLTHSYSEDGEYTVSVSVEGIQTDSIDITVYSWSIDAGIDQNQDGQPDSGHHQFETDEDICFIGIINGENSGCLCTWDFGDGNVTSGSSYGGWFIHYYSQSGIYTATFSVTIDGLTRSKSVEVYITETGVVDPPVISSISPNCKQKTPNERITLSSYAVRGTNEISHFIWRVIGETEWRVASVTQYNTCSFSITNPKPGRCTGEYLVEIIAVDTDGYHSQAQAASIKWTRLDVNINGPNAATDLGCVPFRATGTPPPCFSFDDLTHHWSFGDGHGGSGEIVRHHYDDDGVYFVKLTSYGGIYSDKAYQSIRIYNVAPYSNFSVSPLVNAVDEPTMFDGTAEDLDGEIIGWKYDFDDGRRMYGYSDYEYSYRDSGFYTPEFTTTDDDGDKDTDKRDTETGYKQIIIADAIVDDNYDSNTPKFGVRRFNSIQDAIDSSNVPSENGLIVVLDGTYNEDIVIDKSITIVAVSEGYSNLHKKISFGGVTIDGANDPTSQTTVKITAPNVLLKHLNIQGEGAGIEIYNNTVEPSGEETATERINGVIEDCVISSELTGILIDSSSYITISNCQIIDNLNGIILRNGSEGNLIKSTNLKQNTELRYGEAIKILDSNKNIIDSCLINKYVSGIIIDDSNGTIVNDCRVVNNNIGITVKNVAEKTRLPDPDHEKPTAVYSGDINLITNTNFSSNTYGIFLQNTSYTVIGSQYVSYYLNNYQGFDVHLTNYQLSDAASQGVTMKPTQSGGTPQGSPRPDNSNFENNEYPIFIVESTINAISDCIINDKRQGLSSFNLIESSSVKGITIQNSEYIYIYRTIVKKSTEYGIHVLNSNNVTVHKSLIWQNPVGILFDHSSDGLIGMCSLLNHTTCGIYVSEDSYSNVIKYNNVFRYGREFYERLLTQGSAEDWDYLLDNDTRVAAYDAGVDTLWDDDGEYNSHQWFSSFSESSGAGNYWSDYNWEYYIQNLLDEGNAVIPDPEEYQMLEWILFNMETGEVIMPDPPQPNPHYEWVEIGEDPYNITVPEGHYKSQDRYPVFPYPFIWCSEWLNTDKDPRTPIPPEPIPLEHIEIERDMMIEL